MSDNIHMPDDSGAGEPGGIENHMRERSPGRVMRMENALRQRQQDLTVILANIHDPHNVSAIYRSCDAFGVAKVHLYYTNTPFPALGLKSSASARKWVETERHKNADEMFSSLHGQGIRILATSFSERSKSLWDWDFLLPTAIIFGNEHSGVERELVERADGELSIPMHGLIQSLNVSVAAAVVLAEAARQREKAGYYEKSRMPEEAFRAKLAQWLKK